MTVPDIGAVVVTRNRPDLFELAAASVEAQGLPIEGVVVDNGPDDETRRIAERLGWRYLTEGRNLSFSQANNWAMSEMDAERVLLLNNDALLEGGCLEALLGHDAAVVGSLIVHPDGSVEHAGVRVPTTETEGPYHLGRGDAPDRWIGRCEATQATTFAAALVRRRAYLDAGGMDEEYWYGFEDVDLCLRIRERGGEVITCRDARVLHAEKTTRGDEFDELNFERFRKIWLSSGRAAAVLAGVSHGTAGEHPASPMAEPRTSDPSFGHHSRSEIATDEPTAPYGAYYYDNYCGEQAYRHGVDAWSTFFGQLAEHIALEFAPRKVLDAGCAKGFLVEALRDRGIDAYGVDFSDYAIASVREDIRPYCWVGSLTEDLRDDYELIVCIEVLEHMTSDESEIAIANICRHTDDVLFSSTPNDYGEATHINLHSAEWWAERFARNGFFRDTGHDASYLTAWAVRFRRGRDPLARVIGSYEGVLARSATEARERAALVLEQAEALEEQGRELAELRTSAEPLRMRVAELESQLAAIHGSTTYRMAVRAYRSARRMAPEGTRRGSLVTATGRRVLGRRGRLSPSPQAEEAAPADDLPAQYARWIRAHEPSPAELDAMRAESETWTSRPMISVVVPVFDPAAAWLQECIGSVRAQTYADWELCLADDASTLPHVRTILEEAASADPRIKVTFRERNGGIAAASNSAFELASGEYVGLLDHDDLLRPHALHRMARYLIDHPDAGLVYSDEDKLFPDGTRGLPSFKPDWSPDLLLSANYLCHFTVLRRDLFDKLGGFREGFDGSQDHDLFLRAEEAEEPIGHVPDVLYDWRVVPGSAALLVEEKPQALVAGVRALEEALVRRGVHGSVELGAYAGWYDVHYSVGNDPTIAVIASGDVEPRMLDDLRSSGHQVIVRPGAPAHGRVLNGAAEDARSDHLLFLDGVTRAITPGWIRPLQEQAERREVGAVGCRLLHTDGQVAHEGIVLGMRGQVVDADLSEFRDGFCGPAHGIRDVGAVSGGCMMLRRELFEELGGFDPAVGAYYDADLCLRLREHGYRIVYTPLVELIRPDAEPRVARATPEELAAFEERWGSLEDLRDPFISPHVEWLTPLTLKPGRVPAS